MINGSGSRDEDNEEMIEENNISETKNKDNLNSQENYDDDDGGDNDDDNNNNKKMIDSNSDSNDSDGISLAGGNGKNLDKCPDEETVLLSNEDLSFAPGENNIPRSPLFDKNAESCTFIKIYAGTLRTRPNHLSHQKVLQSEIARSDRRCCDPYRLFHAAGMLRIEKMSQKICICMK